MLKGHRVSYIPGWDCHGLPIELKALEAVKKGDAPPTPTQLRRLARETALQQIEQQKQAFVSWGVMGDWENAYKTMDHEYESRQIGVFLKLFHRVTALAEAELEYNENHVSPSVYVRFPVSQGGEKFSTYQNLALMIWTTTPWTLPANKALCVNSEFSYCITTHDEGKTHSIVAEGLLSKLEAVLEKKLPVLHVMRGSEIVGVVCEHPFRPQPSPVLHGDHVTLESGTGVVHTAPGHGVEDFKICAENDIPSFVPVNDYGKFTAEAGERFQGKFVLKEGNEEVLKILKEVGVLVHFSEYKHKYPYDWRTKKPVIIRATSQWFAGLTGIRDQATSELKQNVVFTPSYGLSRLSAMVNTRDDWCISRQRAWGVPIPVFFDMETQEPLINEETIAHIQKLFLEHGSDCWWDFDVRSLLPPSYQDVADKYQKGNDTMDVWFDSGVSWDAVVNARGLPKADVYLEGSDQHRGWFQSSLLTSVGATDQAPYKKIVTHGFVLDGDGRKMSKSLGNVIEPSAVIQGGKVGKEQFEGFGVDALRFWVASMDYSGDVNISAILITEMSNQIRKLRNTARFMLGNLSDYDGLEVPYSELLDLDKYMLHKLSEFMTHVTQNYENFSFAKVVQSLLVFGNIELSAFYFDVIKDRLYTSPPESTQRRSAQFVMSQILQAFTTVMAPILCHTTEDIFRYSSLKKENRESIFHCGWFVPPEYWKNAEIEHTWKRFRELRHAFHIAFEETKKDYPDFVRTTADVDVTIAVKRNSELHELIKKVGVYFVGEVFIASSVNYHIQDDLGEKEWDLYLVANGVQKCPRCWKRVKREENLFCDKQHCPSE